MGILSYIGYDREGIVRGFSPTLHLTVLIVIFTMVPNYTLATDAQGWKNLPKVATQQ